MLISLIFSRILILKNILKIKNCRGEEVIRSLVELGRSIEFEGNKK